MSAELFVEISVPTVTETEGQQHIIVLQKPKVQIVGSYS